MELDVTLDTDLLYEPLADIIWDSEYAEGPGAPALEAFLKEYGPQELLDSEAEFTQLATELSAPLEDIPSEWEDLSWEAEIMGSVEVLDAAVVDGVDSV